MNILKHSMQMILLLVGLVAVFPISAEENDSSNVPPMMHGYGMPMMGGQWSGPPANAGQWNGMPMMGNQWGRMPMMGGQWNGMPMMGNSWGGMPMMHGYWQGGMPCQQTVDVQQMSQRLAHIEEQLTKLLEQKKR